MFNDQILAKVSSYYPKFQLKFKNETWFMKILGFLMFWNKDFMSHYATTIGNTIYFPNKNWIGPHPVSVFAVLLHELVHIHDSENMPPFLYTFLFLCPQILIIFTPLLLCFLGPLSLLLLICIFPIPSYFRMNFEKRAYLVSLYVLNQLNHKLSANIDLNHHKDNFLKDFKNGNYYFMWPFSLEKEFDEAIKKILAGNHPYEDKELFKILDDILDQY